MGGCLSKKGSSSFSPPASAAAAPTSDKCSESKQEQEQKKIVQAEEIVKKEIFIIKQRKSHERRLEDKVVVVVGGGGGGGEAAAKDEICNNNKNANTANVNGGIIAPVRTSSCTKEEVDAILIQCGRLSRSSSGKGGGAGPSNVLGSSGSRKTSGTKRSYDFDRDDDSADNRKGGGNRDAYDEEEEKQHLHQSRPSHRRTPSREKDGEYKRSGSRERASSRGGEERRRSNGGGSGSGSGRRVSRSPGRRSETPTNTSAPASAPTQDKSRPGKIVSVPPTVSTTRDKSNNSVIPESTMSIKRISATRTAASPRSQSPANNARGSNENAHNNQPQLPSLSRNSSRKAEHSPYRRNPLSEIDENSLRNEQLSLKAQDQVNSNTKMQRIKQGDEGQMKKSSHLQSQIQKPDERDNKAVELPQGTNNNNNRRSPRKDNANCCRVKEDQQLQIAEEPIVAKEPPQKTIQVSATIGGMEDDESLKPQTITRSRSSRRSRDLDLNLSFNSDALLNPSSYASLLLEDIQNFHQQSTTAFSLPPCVTKACSILEAVADLNSCTSSNLSSGFSEERCSEADRINKKNNNNASSTAHLGKRRMEAKDPFVESEVLVSDDLMEPSLHKYVTVRRGVMGGETEQQESSGSNSFVTPQWASSSWELNSADSTDRWTSSRSNTGEAVDETQPSCKNMSEAARDVEVEGRRLKQSGNNTPLHTAALSGRKRELDHQVGVRRGKVGARGKTIPIVAAASM